MRGFYEGRYRDANLLTAQIEYRFPVIWRFGAVVFASAGEVASSVPGLFSGRLKVAAGTGIRFMFDRDNQVNVRADVAFASNGNYNGYINIVEAF